MNIFIKPPNLIAPDVKAFFTTKAVNNSLKELLKDIGIPEEHIYLPVQKHTNNVMVLENEFKPVIADAILTRRAGVLIGVQVADCVPILLYDKKKSVIGAVHAGWRGTAARILRNTIEMMQKRFNSSPVDILIAIGPGIRQCCYCVGNDVKDAVCRATGEGQYHTRLNGKYFIDLSSANRIQALSTGIPGENIWQSGECTHCNPEKFHSYRYTKNSAGRQGGFIGII